MKKLFKVALVAVCMISMGNFAKAQTKIGYINTNDLIQAMPELKTVNTQMDAFKKTFMDVLQNLGTELQTKSADYQSKQATMTDAVKTVKQSELADLQKRAQDYQTNAQQQVEAKGNELMKPLLDKVHNAISAVAKEKGYNYVLDSSQTALLVSPPADDLMAAVKLKLGVK
ncbi:OmpH family outer membrane protein [Mucilaginibacter sp. UR6-11]|uniref:OmpH family outer membrane protein n=1 Tax=Mucilaginibacter sp. UR6-11 TaxID=1435644 RepID=UPI001E48121C|nr:OmpH family outer membrane protein [Mucilaginibacter sp. UR6-11]MCC8423891.1 OmpH family outer membrane protein [Mucilaginibacter sp. UR6-11]